MQTARPLLLSAKDGLKAGRQDILQTHETPSSQLALLETDGKTLLRNSINL